MWIPILHVSRLAVGCIRVVVVIPAGLQEIRDRRGRSAALIEDRAGHDTGGERAAHGAAVVPKVDSVKHLGIAVEIGLRTTPPPSRLPQPGVGASVTLILIKSE